jgi:hypothetical protein
MAMTQREERALLSAAEFELVAPTHYPALGSLPPAELRRIATRLRDQHARARDLLREGRRARRGKGDARGAATAQAERLAVKKQAFAAALKRVNRRFATLGEARG